MKCRLLINQKRKKEEEPTDFCEDRKHREAEGLFADVDKKIGRGLRFKELGLKIRAERRMIFGCQTFILLNAAKRQSY